MTHLQRRQMMLVSGSSLAGISSSPAIAKPAAPSTQSLHLGVLVPASARDAQLGHDYLEGLQLALSEATGPLEFRLTAQPFGPEPRAAMQALDALLASSRPPDLLVGWIGMHATHRLGATLNQAQRPFLASDLGAQPVQARDANAWIATQSLGYWQSCARLGQELARNGKRHALICQGFHEAGFGFVHEFERHYKAAGGLVVERHTSGMPQHEDEFHGLGPLLGSKRPDVVVAFYSGRQAARFKAAYAATPLARRRHFAGPAFGGQLGLELGAPTTLLTPWPDSPPIDGRHDSPALRLGHAAGERILAGMQDARWSHPPARVGILARLEQQSTQGCDQPFWLTRSDNRLSQSTTCVTAMFGGRPIEFNSQARRSGWLNTYLMT